MDESQVTTLYCQTGTVSGCEYTVKVTCVVMGLWSNPDTTYVYLDECLPVCYTDWGKEYRESLAAEARRIAKRLACRSGWVELRKAFIGPIRHAFFTVPNARNRLGHDNIGCLNFARV